jgi:glycerol uptake facilitator-like aquaporin
MAGLAIGGTVAMAALMGGPISGASMNPARSFAPALVDGNIQHLWIYFVGPILGAYLGALCYQKISCPQTEESFEIEDSLDMENVEAKGCC